MVHRETRRVLSRSARLAGIALLMAFPCFQGCSLWNRWTGAEESEREAAVLETEFRPKAQKSEPYFFDERARQIERNLGM
jgi:hypothetical protein